MEQAKSSGQVIDDIPEIQPLDEHNQVLVSYAHPEGWENPRPEGRYNLVVIGGGTAGLVSAAGAAGMGARVALIERKLLGGDCLNAGCVPSKALLRCARAAADVRDAHSFGLPQFDTSEVNFGAVMERMRRLRAGISEHDSAQRFKDLGMDVFIGDAEFAGPDRVRVGDAELRFSKAVIATGARAGAPPIEGLEQAGYLTNETVFSLTELPRRLAVIGAGAIGCELSQAFARFGSQVFLIESMHGVLPKEDPEASEFVRQSLQRDGIEIICCGREAVISSSENGKHLALDSHGQRHEIEVDEILVGVGRVPNTEGLGLEAAGVDYGPKGVKVNDRLQTSNPRVYAAGDICSKYQFTHAADAMARIVIRNALFLGRARASALTIPWCTYTDPELAQVGLSAQMAEEGGIPVDVFVQRMDAVDRAILDGETEGLVKVVAEKGKGRILGATIVARHAGDMISEISLAITAGLGLKALSNTIHPYPTQAEAIRRVGDAYNRSRLTPGVKNLFSRWLAWCR